MSSDIGVRSVPRLRFLAYSYRLAIEAFRAFVDDDGWAIASHIALSALMSMFPFFLVLTAIAGIIGSKDLADEAARLVLEAWPEEVSAPIASEIHNVLTAHTARFLTVGALLALYFASSGIESLRIGSTARTTWSICVLGGSCAWNRSATSSSPPSRCSPCRFSSCSHRSSGERR